MFVEKQALQLLKKMRSPGRGGGGGASFSRCSFLPCEMGMPSLSLHYSMQSCYRLRAGTQSWWRLDRQQALASKSGSSHRRQTPVKHAVDQYRISCWFGLIDEVRTLTT